MQQEKQNCDSSGDPPKPFIIHGFGDCCRWPCHPRFHDGDAGRALVNCKLQFMVSYLQHLRQTMSMLPRFPSQVCEQDWDLQPRSLED